MNMSDFERDVKRRERLAAQQKLYEQVYKEAEDELMKQDWFLRMHEIEQNRRVTHYAVELFLERWK